MAVSFITHGVKEKHAQFNLPVLTVPWLSGECHPLPIHFVNDAEETLYVSYNSVDYALLSVNRDNSELSS